MGSFFVLRSDLDKIPLMTKEWKDRLEKIAIGAVPPILVLILTAAIKGEELTGLSKAAAVLHLLRIGVPLWLFLIVLVVALLASAYWIQTVILRKETLRVVWRPEQCLWGTGSSGSTPIMQIITSGYLTNTAKEHRLIITSVYLQGTKPVLGMFEPVEIEPETCGEERIDAYVEPIVGTKGEVYKGKMVLVDQFGVKHRVPIELKSMLPKDVDESKVNSANS